MEKDIKVFKAIGDETRMKILLLLANRNICAKGIAKHLCISEAAVSQHIKILKEAKLIVGNKRGYHIIYEINKATLEGSVNFLKLLINQDIPSSFDVVTCKHSCKSMKSCCKKLLMEE